MISTIDEQIGILTKFNITADELFVVHCILLAQENDDTSYLAKYLQINDAKDKFHNILVRLQEKKIINKSYRIPNKGETFDPFEVEFNKNFTKQFHRDCFEMGKELFDNYPVTAIINGSLVIINSVCKKFDSIEQCYIAYGKAINFNEETHKKVLDTLEWAKNQGNLLTCSLANFIVDRKWDSLEKIRNGEFGNFNYDSIKMI